MLLTKIQIPHRKSSLMEHDFLVLNPTKNTKSMKETLLLKEIIQSFINISFTFQENVYSEILVPVRSCLISLSFPQ